MSIQAAKLHVTVGADVDGADRGIDQVDRKIGGFVKGAGASMLGFLGRDVVQASLRAGVALIGVGMDYEQSLNTFQAVSGANVSEMGRVRDQAKALGNDLTLPATSAADATEAMTELAKAGMGVNQTLGASKGVLQLAAAAQTDEANAAKITANALNAYELAAGDAGMVADVLAASANASSAEISDMSDSLAMASAVAHMAGVDLDDTATAIGELANKGVKGSDAGTSLKQMLLSLLAPTQKAKSTMAEYGLSVYDAAGQVKPMRELVSEFTSKLGGLSAEQRNAALSTIFGSDAVRAANIVLLDGVASWDSMNEAVNRHGAAADLAEAKSKGLRGALDALQSQVETVAIGFYEKASPAVEEFVRGAAADLPAALNTAGDAFIAIWDVAGPVVTDLGDVLVDLTGFVIDVAEAGAPVAGIFVAIAGTGIVGLLEGIVAIIGPVAGWLNDSAVAADLLAGALTAIAVSAGISVLGQLAGTVLMAVANSAYAAAGGMGALKAGIAGIGLGTAAVAGAVAGLVIMDRVMKNVRASTIDLANALPGSADIGAGFNSFRTHTLAVRELMAELQGAADKGNGLSGALKETFQNLNPGAPNDIASATDAFNYLNGVWSESAPVLQQWGDNLSVVMAISGRSQTEVEGLAASLGVDLTQGGIKGEAAVDGLIASFNDMEVAAGHSADEISIAAASTGVDMEAIAKAAQELRDAMAGSFGSATSIVDAFADATSVSAADVMAHFAEMTTAAADWSTNLVELAHAGIDQGLLEELAVAGPKSAALVQGMLDAVRTGNVDAINLYQASLGQSLAAAQQAVIDAKNGFGTAGWNNGVAAGQGLVDGLGSAGPALQQTMANLTALTTMSKAGKVVKNPDIFWGAAGGIFDHPQVIGVGEAGKEVLLPLTDPRRARELADEAGLYDVLGLAGAASGATAPMAAPQSPAGLWGAGGGSSTVVNVEVDASGSLFNDTTVNQLGAVISDYLRDVQGAGGDIGYRP